MTIGYQIIEIPSSNADGATLLSKVEAAIASNAPILLFIGGVSVPVWASSAKISEGVATVNTIVADSYLTISISSEGVDVVAQTITTEELG